MDLRVGIESKRKTRTRRKGGDGSGEVIHLMEFIGAGIRTATEIAMYPYGKKIRLLKQKHIAVSCIFMLPHDHIQMTLE